MDEHSFCRINRKSQKHISRHRIGIAGIHKDHAAHNCRPRSVQRTTVRAKAIGSMKFLNCIEIPQDAAIPRIIRAQMTIERSCKNSARN